MAQATTWSELLPYCTPEELKFLETVAAQHTQIWTPLEGPQMLAYESEADIVGYGGAAGGGKTDLIAGLALTKHERVLITRREKAQTEGVVQRLTEIVGTTDGYNSQKSIWRLDGKIIEFAGIDNPGDERRWQGRPHDLKAFDEVTEMREHQVRFMMGWLRSSNPNVRTRVLMTFNPPTTAEGRWVIEFFAPWLDSKHPNPAVPGELRWFTTIKGKDVEMPDNRPFVMVGDDFVYDFNPADYKPESIIKPKSRTFFPARVTDNPFYMETEYMQTLQALPEPLRSQMLYGDFQAGIEDDPWQVIPTSWVEAAMAHWEKPLKVPEMLSVGIDVARGGKDETVIARKHAPNWYDMPLVYPGTETPDGPSVAGLVIAASRDRAVQNIDVIGVGSSPYDFLSQANQPVYGINVAEKATETDKSGMLTFFNLRSQLWWQMREDLDPTNNTGIVLPPDKKLLADLCAPKWELRGKTIKVESREEILGRIGRSPDRGSAYVLARIETPKAKYVPGLRNNHGIHNTPSRAYNPYDNLR